MVTKTSGTIHSSKQNNKRKQVRGRGRVRARALLSPGHAASPTTDLYKLTNWHRKQWLDSDARENHCLGRCPLQTLEIKFLVCRSSALWQVTFK